MTGEPIRVAFDARSLASPVLRGWDRYTIGLSRALVKQGVPVTWLCRKREPVHQAHAVAAGCAVKALDDFGGLWWEQIALPLAMRDFDLYHAPAEHGVPLLSLRPVVLTIHSMTAHSYAGLIASGKLRGSMRDYLGYDLNPWAPTSANRYWYAQLKRANAIIAPSEFARAEILPALERLGVAAPNVVAIPLAADDSFHAPRSTPHALDQTLQALGVRRPYLLFVGGYEPHKNVPGLLEMFVRFRQTRPGFQLVLAGSRVPDAALVSGAKSMGLEPGRDVVWLSGLGPELPALYDGAELFVSLSWRESFGLPALEAMTRGVAVVVSAWGAGPEVVGDGGLLVDPRDARAAAAAVERLVRDASRGDRARAEAARFSWEQTADRTLALYRSLLRR